MNGGWAGSKSSGPAIFCASRRPLKARLHRSTRSPRANQAAVNQTLPERHTGELRPGGSSKSNEEKTMTATDMQHQVVSREEWLEARTRLLAEERDFTHRRDELSRKRRELPWVRVEKPYVFDGLQSRVALQELFQGRSELIVYHFMFGPGWKEGCPSCSFLADHFDG